VINASARRDDFKSPQLTLPKRSDRVGLMISRLLITAFLAAVACNSLAAATPHLDGDGGCEAKCCQAARQNAPESSSSRLRCIMDCNQPVGTTSPLTVISLLDERQKKSTDVPVALRLETLISSPASHHPHLPTPYAHNSAEVYLRVGALLI